jgi:2Fe-2S ferredoxin
MPKVTFISHDGQETTVDVAEGTNVMRAAVDHGVAGIDGDCGGRCACATCHVFVEPDWLAKTGDRTDTEIEMLGFANGAQAHSRLGCQIKMTAALDGLTVRMPQSQF